jgi:hypothetical protein
MLNKDYKCRSFLFEQAYHAKHQLSCMLNIKMSVLQARFNHMHKHDWEQQNRAPSACKTNPVAYKKHR